MLEETQLFGTFNVLHSTVSSNLTSHSKLHTNDPTISRRHLKIYSIVYDEDEKTEIQPLVYAENLSPSGMYWNGNYVSKGQGGILLSKNDELKLSPSLTLTFSTGSDPDDIGECSWPETVVRCNSPLTIVVALTSQGLDNLDFAQHREIQVSRSVRSFNTISS